MGRSKGAAARRRKAAATRKKAIADVPRRCPRLLPELLANIHDCLRFLDRIAFAAVFSASCDDDLFQPSPCLLLPGKTTETVELFSVADRCTATVRAPYPALRDHVVLGSCPRGWLATADDRGQIHVVNPATGEQHALPHITTMGVFLPRTQYHFTVWIKRLLTVRFGSGPPFRDNHWGAEGYGTCTFPADTMRMLFYRKIVLSASPRRRPGSYGAAMLILHRDFGAPAFATAEDGAWKLAPSEGGVEEAIHHDGRFYSVSYSGVVEAWHRDAESGAYTSTAVTPRLAIHAGENPRKYLAAAPGGRLMVALKYPTMERHSCDRWTCSFKVHVLGDDGQWKETRDIGDLALFVGVNNSLCVPTRRRPEIEASCVYFIGDDELGDAGVYSLKYGTVKKMEALEQQQCPSFSRRPVWIAPSIHA